MNRLEDVERLERLLKDLLRLMDLELETFFISPGDEGVPVVRLSLRSTKTTLLTDEEKEIEQQFAEIVKGIRFNESAVSPSD